MFRVKEYREYPDRLADLLPWAAIIAPGVVLNKDGSFQKTIALRGPDLASSTDSELVAMMAQLNNVLKRLGSGWALYTEAVRQESQFYPKHNNFKKNASLLVEEERYELLKKFQKEVIANNPKIVSQKILTHLWSGKVVDGYFPVITISEYNSMEDADNAGDDNPALFSKAFSEEEGAAYAKYWAPGRHEDIGLFNNWLGANK